MNRFDSDKFIKGMEELEGNFEDFQESFYNSKEYEVEEDYELMNERDLKGDI